MHNRPPVAHGVRVATAGLTLAVHGLLVLVLIVEDRDLLRPLPPARKLTGMWIHLQAPISPPDDIAVAARLTPAPATRPLQQRPRPSIESAPAPQAAPEATDPSAPESRPRVDWELAAQRLAANVTEDPVTFSPPPETMRRPCTPRNYDAAIKARMNELLPPPRDLPSGGADSSQKSVQMGGVRVGIITLVPGRGHTSTGDDVSKSSFKWKWDHKSTGSAALTLGWEPPPEYDGMFDDMKAGKTPDSSVPDPDVCD
jgi:hypothetical protein